MRTVLRTLRKGDDAVVPIIGGRPQPLLAAYRVRIAPRLQALLDDGAYGLRDIPRTSAVRQVGEWELISDAELDAADPRLDSALNANTPEEWAELVARTDAWLKPGVDGAIVLKTTLRGRWQRHRRTDDLDLAAPDERRLAVVEDDGEPSVGRDRVGRAVPTALDQHAPAAERVAALEVVREAGHALVEPLPVAVLELGQNGDETGAAIERMPCCDPKRGRRESRHQWQFGGSLGRR